METATEIVQRHYEALKAKQDWHGANVLAEALIELLEFRIAAQPIEYRDITPRKFKKGDMLV